MGEDGTVLVATGTDRRTLIRIAGKNDIATRENPAWQIADDYVPVGTTSFHVKDAGGLKTGDTVEVIRPSTKEWIDALGTTDFGGGLNDWRLVWHPGNYDLMWDRQITKVDGNLVSLDSPITTAMETNFGGGMVKTYSWPGRIENIGVENIRLESTFDASNPKDENHSWFAVTMENAADAWVRQVTFPAFCRAQPWRFMKAASASRLRIAFRSRPFRKMAAGGGILFLPWASKPCFYAVARKTAVMIFPWVIAPLGQMHLLTANLICRWRIAAPLKAGRAVCCSTTCELTAAV